MNNEKQAGKKKRKKCLVNMFIIKVVSLPPPFTVPLLERIRRRTHWTSTAFCYRRAIIEAFEEIAEALRKGKRRDVTQTDRLETTALVHRPSRAWWSDDNGTRSIPQTSQRDISFRVCVRIVALLCRVEFFLLPILPSLYFSSVLSMYAGQRV